MILVHIIIIHTDYYIFWLFEYLFHILFKRNFPKPDCSYLRIISYIMPNPRFYPHSKRFPHSSLGVHSSENLIIPYFTCPWNSLCSSPTPNLEGFYFGFSYLHYCSHLRSIEDHTPDKTFYIDIVINFKSNNTVNTIEFCDIIIINIPKLRVKFLKNIIHNLCSINMTTVLLQP